MDFKTQLNKEQWFHDDFMNEFVQYKQKRNYSSFRREVKKLNDLVFIDEKDDKIIEEKIQKS